MGTNRGINLGVGSAGVKYVIKIDRPIENRRGLFSYVTFRY